MPQFIKSEHRALARYAKIFFEDSEHHLTSNCVLLAADCSPP